MTKSMMHYVIQLTAITTLLAVALFLGMQWRRVKNLDKANLAKRVEQLEINEPLAIAHSMKEQFRSFWSSTSKKEGLIF